MRPRRLLTALALWLCGAATGMPASLLYATARVDRGGVLQLREDFSALSGILDAGLGVSFAHGQSDLPPVGGPPGGPDPRDDGVNRRRFIALAAWGAAATLLPAGAGAALPPRPGSRRLSLHNLHTDERCEACYMEQGTYVPAALEQIDGILRDHRTGEVRRIAPRLLDVLHALTARLGETGPVQVISGYRSAATNALLRADDPGGVAGRSLHLTGEAVDVRFENRPLSRVRDAALSLRGGGVGYYPDSGFVHLDIGRVRRW